MEIKAYEYFTGMESMKKKPVRVAYFFNDP
jgi:hypothetical protein